MRKHYLFAGAVGALAIAVVMLAKPSSADENRKEEKKEAGKSPTASQLPIAQVVLFSSGVGYFQREGQVDGDQRVDLTFPTSDINDLIKSLTLRDLDGGRVASVSYDGNAPIERTLQSFAINLTGNPTFGALLIQARGEKVEVVLQQTNATQPGTLSGTIIGIEKQRQAVGKDAAVEVEILNLWCADGMRSLKLADVQRIRFLNPIMESEFKKALETVSLSHDTQKKSVSIHFAGQGKRGVKVGYVIENPLWKTSYRLVLDKDKKTKPYLQGWAVVENVTDEDWNDVKMALISGRPISFQMNLYDALFLKRPVVEPELFASLRPQVYSGAIEFPPAAKWGSVPGGFGGRSGASREKMMKEGGGAQDKAVKKLENAKMAVEMDEDMDLKVSVASSAHGEKLGDYFQYVIDHPVTLARQKSALLPIVTKEVEGDRVSIFNENTHAKYPLLGLIFKNTTGMHLSQGPITVYEGATYGGDARILDLQKNEQRLLSYAIDLGTEVMAVRDSDSGKFTTIKVQKGIVQSKTKVSEKKTYTIANRNEENRVVVIEHPNRTDFTLTSKDKPWETARDVHRFKVDVPATKTVPFTVTEERIINSRIELTNLDDQNIRIFINAPVTSQAVKSALEDVMKRRAKLAETQKDLQQAQRKLADIEKDQARLRQNLREMPPTAEAYKRYLKKFDEQETEIEQLQAAIKKLQDQELAQKKEFDAFLGSLTVE